MSSPLVSVILPVYNGEPYLRLAIESILGQTLRSFEFLLMDDGSRDSSLAILHEYGRLDKRIRVVANGHRGQTATLNHGLRLAQANLVAKMDADDISRPGRLSAQYERFASDPSLWVLGTAVEEIDDQGRVIGKPRAEPDPGKNSSNILQWSPVWHPSVMMRRDRIMAIGGYRAFEHAEDYDLWLRVDAHNGKISNLTTVGLQYRIHPAGVSIVHKARQERSARLAKIMYVARPSIIRRRWLRGFIRTGASE